MPNLEQTAANLPTTDKDGNPIDLSNPLTLADILVRALESADPVLGARPDGRLESPQDSPVNWAILGLFLRDIFLDQSIEAIGEQLVALGQQITALAGQTVPHATTTQAGIAEFGNLNEIRQGAADKMVNGLTLLDFLRNGTGAGATTSRKGTVELATFIEAQQGDATNLVLSVAAALSQLRAPIAQAKENQRGTAFRATQTQAEGRTDDDAMMTAKKTHQAISERQVSLTQAEYNALTTKEADVLYLIV